MTSGNFSPTGSTLGFFISNASKAVSLHLMHFCFRFSQIRLGNTIKCGSQGGASIHIYIYTLYNVHNTNRATWMHCAQTAYDNKVCMIVCFKIR